MTPLDMFIEHYGLWIGFVLYIFVVHGIPFIRKQWWPQHVKREEEQRKSSEAEKQSRINELAEQRKSSEAEKQSRINELAEERKWHRQIEMERAGDLKAIREVVQAMNNNLTQVNASLNSVRMAETDIMTNQRIIMDKQDNHHNSTMDAIGEMREEVARRRGIEEGKKHADETTGGMNEMRRTAARLEKQGKKGAQ